MGEFNNIDFSPDGDTVQEAVRKLSDNTKKAFEHVYNIEVVRGADGTPGEKGSRGEPGPEGVPGETGADAYEVAVSGGFVGDRGQWLASLRGDSGPKGEKGDTGGAGAEGPPGDSAYEVWLTQGNTGTKSSFLAAIKGEKGDQGVPGASGALGEDGLGVPAGGTAGQVLSKVDAATNNTRWVDPSAAVSDHGSLAGLSDDDHTIYALANGSRGDFAATGHTHDYAASNHTHDYAPSSHSHSRVEYSTFFMAGSLTVKSGVGRDPVFSSGNVTAVRAAINTAPSGSNVSLSIRKNGSEITTMNIIAGANSASVSGLNLPVSAGDYLSVNVISVGSSTAGSDLTVKVQRSH